MPKPIGEGFKFHCLADQDIWDFQPTTSHSGPDPVPAVDGQDQKAPMLKVPEDTSEMIGRRACQSLAALMTTITIWGVWILQISFVAITALSSLPFAPGGLCCLDTTITNAYLIHLDMLQASKIMAHKEFRLQYAWGLILAGIRPIATPHPSRSIRTETAWPYVGEDTELPPDRSCDCGRHPVHRPT